MQLFKEFMSYASQILIDLLYYYINYAYFLSKFSLILKCYLIYALFILY